MAYPKPVSVVGGADFAILLALCITVTVLRCLLKDQFLVGHILGKQVLVFFSFLCVCVWFYLFIFLNNYFN